MWLTCCKCWKRFEVCGEDANALRAFYDAQPGHTADKEVGVCDECWAKRPIIPEHPRPHNAPTSKMSDPPRPLNAPLAVLGVLIGTLSIYWAWDAYLVIGSADFVRTHKGEEIFMARLAVVCGVLGPAAGAAIVWKALAP